MLSLFHAMFHDVSRYVSLPWEKGHSRVELWWDLKPRGSKNSKKRLVLTNPCWLIIFDHSGRLEKSDLRRRGVGGFKKIACRMPLLCTGYLIYLYVGDPTFERNLIKIWSSNFWKKCPRFVAVCSTLITCIVNRWFRWTVKTRFAGA